mmetsp:Transcript_101788/g.287100  ORF Transcript_101788/g.287100 Transcript_101788/m.287100 type:complete len:211 (-) Transcript_101788:77-709(-)
MVLLHVQHHAPAEGRSRGALRAGFLESSIRLHWWADRHVFRLGFGDSCIGAQVADSRGVQFVGLLHVGRCGHCNFGGYWHAVSVRHLRGSAVPLLARHLCRLRHRRKTVRPEKRFSSPAKLHSRRQRFTGYCRGQHALPVQPGAAGGGVAEAVADAAAVAKQFLLQFLRRQVRVRTPWPHEYKCAKGPDMLRVRANPNKGTGIVLVLLIG